jgi:hypothetical protein
MSGKQSGRGRWSARAALAIAVVVGVAGLADGAVAADPHRAAVIVETGGDTHRVVITFTEDSITGIEALQRAGADPVVYAFGGQGGAVCRLYGVGRDAGPNCLGGQDGDARYWAYFRAPAGTSNFTYSPIGAGAARVRDGDVEGWRFGTGQAPQHMTVDALAPAPPPPPGTSGGGGATRPAPPLAGSGATATNGANAAGPPASGSTLPQTGATASSSGDTKAAADDGATGSTGSRATDSDERAEERRAAATETALASSSDADEGGSSAMSLVWLAVLLAAIGVAIVIVRRVRRRAATGS